MESRDLYRYARLAAEESGAKTQGDRACWNRDHWWNWVTDKVVEHIKGDVCWQQFGESSFGVLNGDETLRHDLLDSYESFKTKGPAAPESSMFIEQVNGLLVS